MIDLAILSDSYSEELELPDTQAHIGAIDDKLSVLYEHRNVLVSALNRKISYLQTRRNALVPIARLPNEMLSKIFFQYASMGNLLFNLKWTKLLLICRSWYDICIQHGSLWSFIDWDVKQPAHLKDKSLQLERSGLHLLTVKLSASFFHGRIMTILMPHIGRIQDLEVTGSVEHVSFAMSSIFKDPIPRLRFIKVSPENYRQEKLFFFPDSIVSGSPLLRSLALTDLRANWKIFRNLVELCLTRKSEKVPVPSFPELASLLKQSPSLKILKLNRFISPNFDNLQELVQLPNLESLEMNDLVSGCASLLSILQMSSTAAVWIASREICKGADIRHLMDPLAKHCNSPLAPPMRLLHIQMIKTHMKISAYTTTSPTDKIFDHASAHMFLGTYPDNGTSRREILSAVIQSLPLDSLTHLDTRMAVSSCLTKYSWMTILSRIPSIHTVILTVHSTLALAESLLKLMNSDSTLHMQCLDISGNPFSFRESSIPRLTMPTLIEVATRYRDLGVPMKTLKMRQCWTCFSELDIGILSSLVDDMLLLHDANIFTSS